MSILCKWKKEGRVLVNPDGQVYPCCYLCNPHYRFLSGNKERMTNEDDKTTHTQHIWDEYLNKKDELNVKNKPLEEIIQDEWFTKTLPKSWESEDTALKQCIEHCTVDE